MLWQRFLQNRSQFFVEREEGFCTIRCLTSIAGATLSAGRKKEMMRFAVVAALLYINGHTPMPLSPAVILFTIYGADLNCLTPAFIGEWFVTLRKRLLDWLEMGPGGDLQPFAAHFASFHDTEAGFYLICYNQLAYIFSQVSAYRQRDHITHQAIAVEMLYNAALGPTSHRHPEWASFIAAFNLPCRNGFKFTEVSIFKDKTQSDLQCYVY